MVRIVRKRLHLSPSAAITLRVCGAEWTELSLDTPMAMLRAQFADPFDGLIYLAYAYQEEFASLQSAREVLALSFPRVDRERESGQRERKREREHHLRERAPGERE